MRLGSGEGELDRARHVTDVTIGDTRQTMGAPPRLRPAALLMLAGLAMLSPPAPAATPPPPKTTPCGDMVGGAWSVKDRVSGKSLKGSHYTVTALNFPCAKARAFVAKLTRRTSLMQGPAPLLPGFLCISGIPKGLQLQHGACIVARTPEELMPRPDFKSFGWQACVAVPSRNEHVSCTRARFPESSRISCNTGMIDVPGGRVWYERLGSGGATPLLALHGGPGRRPLLPAAVRRPHGQAPARDRLRPARLRRVGEARRPVALDRRSRRAGARRGARGARARALPPVRPVVGRLALDRVPQPAAATASPASCWRARPPASAQFMAEAAS